MKNHYRSQGGPFHQEFLLKEENEEKRHRSRCVYYESLEKYCRHYCMKCKGSNACEKYEEKPNVKKIASEDKKPKKPYVSSGIEEKTITVGEKFVEKKHRTIDDIRREIMEFTKNHR